MNETAKSWRTPPEPIPESQIKKTFTADIVVVGAGHAGIATARAAAEAGASVLVVEQMREDRYISWGIDFGHINSEFLKSKGVPEVDVIEFFNDWQLRSGNRSNPKLVMRFARNCGACFDWFLEALTPEQLENVEVRYWPTNTKFPGSINGIHTWVGTATFPEAKWDNKSMTNAVVGNLKMAQDAGADFHFLMKADQLIREPDGGRVTALIAHTRAGEYQKFVGTKAVVLAAGDFAGNAEMMEDLCDELVTLKMKSGRGIRGGGRDGKGIRMGVWVGGRMAPGPIAAMGGNTGGGANVAGGTGIALDGGNKRFCNEGFTGDWVFSGIEGARQPEQTMCTVYSGDWLDRLQHGAPVHSSLWLSNPEDPRMAQQLETMAGLKAGGKNGYTPKDPFEKRPRPGRPSTFCVDTLEELADCLGFEGELRRNFFDSIARYNEFCYKGRDEEFGKDPALLIPIDTPPYYGSLGRLGQGSGSPMVTVDGLWTDEYQNVYDDDLHTISGLYATGNCCGRRFGLQYSTPVAGVSIGIAWTLGRELGKHLATL